MLQFQNFKLFNILGSRLITTLFFHDFEKVFNIRYLFPSFSSFFLAIFYRYITCLFLYLVTFHNALLSMTSLDSSSQSGTLWLIKRTKFSSLNRLALNFQNEGPCFCRSMLLKWRVIAERSELIDGMISVPSLIGDNTAAMTRRPLLIYLSLLTLYRVTDVRKRLPPFRLPYQNHLFLTAELKLNVTGFENYLFRSVSNTLSKSL